ncbi:MAG: PAS domain-containing protein [Candidatus Riflebacteria bacterium]|nr:PAS domain-containing protein [Candidatus Riflebacteria bacterium]
MPAEWLTEFPGSVTVCDADGIILDMNDAAARSVASEGGRALVGKSLFDCHPEPSRTKLRHLLASRDTSVYTIEKAGVKKLIYQAPWYENGRYRGFVEISLELPEKMPHFVRQPR